MCKINSISVHKDNNDIQMLNKNHFHLLPLALSNFLPSALTLGAVCDPF